MRFNHLRRWSSLAVLLAGAGLASCGPKLIPHTEIVDNEDNRDLIAILRKYKEAFDAKDAHAIVALASPHYLDARDSISYDTLETQLGTYFEKTKQLHMEVTPRRAAIEGNHARLDYIYAVNYLLDTADPQWRSQTDDKRMTFVREGNQWKVTSGF